MESSVTTKKREQLVEETQDFLDRYLDNPNMFWPRRNAVVKGETYCPVRHEMLSVELVCQGFCEGSDPFRVASCSAFEDPHMVTCAQYCLNHPAPEPEAHSCPAGFDIDDNGNLGTSDIIDMFQFLFHGGASPAANLR